MKPPTCSSCNQPAVTFIELPSGLRYYSCARRELHVQLSAALMVPPRHGLTSRTAALAVKSAGCEVAA